MKFPFLSWIKRLGIGGAFLGSQRALVGVKDVDDDDNVCGLTFSGVLDPRVDIKSVLVAVSARFQDGDGRRFRLLRLLLAGRAVTRPPALPRKAFAYNLQATIDSNAEPICRIAVCAWALDARRGLL